VHEFGLDSTRLRALLDGIRSGLSKGDVPTGESSVAPSGGGDTLASVRALLEALRKAPVVSPSDSSLSHRLDEHGPRFRQLLAALDDAWIRRILARLGSTRVRALQSLMGRQVPDFLSLLGRANDENSNSDVLGWLLNPRHAPKVAPGALLRIVEVLDDPLTWKTHLQAAIATDTLAVRREYTIAREWPDEERLDRIDIVICSADFVLAIENKVWAAEHDGQTRGYWEWLKGLRVLHGGIFLTPAGMPPASEDFRSLSYLDLVGCLLEGPTHSKLNADEEIVLASYLKTLGGSVLRSEMAAANRPERTV